MKFIDHDQIPNENAASQVNPFIIAGGRSKAAYFAACWEVHWMAVLAACLKVELHLAADVVVYFVGHFAESVNKMRLFPENRPYVHLDGAGHYA